MEISILPYWCTSRITAEEATNPQTKHADRMLLSSSSQKLSQTYLRVGGSQWTCRGEKSDFVIFFLLLLSFFLSHNKTLPKDSLPTKPLLELIYVQDNTAIAVVLAMTTFVCKLARPAVLAIYYPMAGGDGQDHVPVFSAYVAFFFQWRLHRAYIQYPVPLQWCDVARTMTKKLRISCARKSTQTRGKKFSPKD